MRALLPCPERQKRLQRPHCCLATLWQRSQQRERSASVGESRLLNCFQLRQKQQPNHVQAQNTCTYASGVFERPTNMSFFTQPRPAQGRALSAKALGKRKIIDITHDEVEMQSTCRWRSTAPTRTRWARCPPGPGVEFSLVIRVPVSGVSLSGLPSL